VALRSGERAADKRAVKVRINLWPVVALVAVVAGSLALASVVRPAPDDSLTQETDLSGARYGITSKAAIEASLPVLPKPRPLGFLKSTSTGDRRLVLSAIAHARPEARRLIELVAGLVTIGIGPLEDRVAGETTETPQGYDVALDLRLSRTFGARGVDHVILHELGHVIDGAVVPKVMEEKLDATIPRGSGCDSADVCADRAERFAETFAKWATRDSATQDIGATLDSGAEVALGYDVRPPKRLDAWGQPMAKLR
jgi:hypothetical protein